MNNEKEFFVNDVETNVSEDEIILAPPTELIEEAKEIAQNTKSDEKFPFMLQYDANQKEFLLSMLGTVGAIVENDDEEGHTLSTQMNMTQLAFIKQLDAVERVKTDEGINPFLAEEAVKFTPIQQDQQEDESLDTETEERIVAIDEETLEVQTEFVVNSTADANLEVAATAETAEDNDSTAVASVTASARSSCSSCPTNTDKANALTIDVETLISGYICCPGTEQWFKFTVPTTKQYTIFTTGSLDTEGELSGCCLATPIYNDDYAGRVNFRIIETLCAGYEYYIKISAKNDATGSYTLKVTEQVLAESVTIDSQRSDGIILLEEGKTYELPLGEGYDYLYNDGELDGEGTPIYHVPMSVGIAPEGVNEKRVYWYASSIPAAPVNISSAWYDNTTYYQTIKANSCGGTKLYAYDWLERGKCGEIYVVVAPSVSEFVKATSFKIYKEGTTTEISELNMEIGEYQKVVAEVSPSTATVQNVNWVSTNPEVATITPYGRIKAVSSGTTTIRAEAMDGSGVYACCEVMCNILSGTDSIGVFRTLSTLTSSPDATAADAPILLGVQFTDPQDGPYKIRFVSQVKTLDYNGLGHEIHYKFGSEVSVANVISSRIVYKSLYAAGEKIYPDEGFKYFVVGVIENIPENVVASFNVKSFAITLNGEFLYENAILFSCKNAQPIDDVAFEVPEHLSSADPIRVNTGNGSNLNVMSLPSENGTVLGQFVDKKELALLLEAPQNEKWYAVYGRTIDGAYKFGWCSGEYLEKETTFLKFVPETGSTNVRANYSTSSEIVGEISCGMQVELIQEETITNGGYAWYKIKYNDNIAYIAHYSGRYETVVRYVPLRCAKIAIIADRYLTTDEKRHNAKIIYNYLTYKGWSKNAICGALANMEAESSLSPGRWEMSDHDNDGDRAYGLFQWDPPTKWTNYAETHSYAQNDIYRQLDYFIYSTRYGGGEWLVEGVSANYQLYAYEYVYSNRSVRDLAIVFLLCYERPMDSGTSVRDYRADLAETWQSYFDSIGW